jgi:hypothetical protein
VRQPINLLEKLVVFLPLAPASLKGLGERFQRGSNVPFAKATACSCSRCHGRCCPAPRCFGEELHNPRLSSLYRTSLDTTRLFFDNHVRRRRSEEEIKHRNLRWVAPIVVWLASEQSGDVTGRVFEAGGGILKVAEGRHAGPGINPVEDPNGFGPQIMELMRKARPNADISVRFWTPPGVLLRPAAGLKRLPAAFSGFLNAARPPPRPQGCRPACRLTWRGGYASWRAGPAKLLPTASGRCR